MKVAVVSESSADEAAIARLVAAVLSRPIETIHVPVRRGGGWTTVATTLPRIVPATYYATDADGIVIVVDSDDSAIHNSSHDPANAANTKCRICGLIQVVAAAKSRLRSRPVVRPFQIAFGLAIPAIEAWLLCGVDNGVSEASWINDRKQGRKPYTTIGLKKQLYGTDRPSLDQETVLMDQAAERVASRLLLLEQLFPLGFGLLAKQLRDWEFVE